VTDEGLLQLLRALRTARLEFTAEDIADAVWLGHRLEAAAPSPQPVRPDRPSAGEDESSKGTPVRPPTRAAGSGETAGEEAEERGEVVLPRSTGKQPGGRRGIPFRVPGAPALADALQIARALRPLMRWVASRVRQVLDEAETARAVAEEGIWLPALRPAPERWFHVSLVADVGPSMSVWRTALAEVRHLLESMGAFPKVTPWSLATDLSPPLLYPGLRRPAADAIPRDPRELVDPAGRHLVLVVTDAVSPAWHDGTAARVLESWGHCGPVVMLQVLPERLWRRTALGRALPVRLRAPRAAAANVRLHAEPAPPPGAGMAIPVATLEPEPLALCAQLVAGFRPVGAPGLVLNVAPPLPVRPTPAAGARERLKRFWQNTTPTARRLARLLAATPTISLPVIRLIRETMLGPEGRQVHEAEVLLGGLLKVVPGFEGPDRHPDDVIYDFRQGVRDLLLDGLPRAEMLAVLNRSSEYVEKHLGQVRDFGALLARPSEHGGAIAPDDSPIARIAAAVLRRLGGDYARLTRRKTRGHGDVLVPGATPLPGYTLIRRLSQSGFSEVWEAKEPGNVAVALKFVRLDTPAAALAVRALDLMKNVHHPHLLPTLGDWKADGYLIIAMPLAECSLLDRLREETQAEEGAGIPVAELLKYMAEAAKGIDYLNGALNIQHGDIKPPNLLLIGNSVRLADFDLAQLVEETRAEPSGITTLYAAPELLSERPRLSRWSDQYSLAVTYCQLRSSRPPFQGSASDVRNAHLTQAPDLTMLPPAEREVVARALAQDPALRWPDCRTFVAQLAAVAPRLPPALTNAFGMKLVLVPRGTFWTGDRGRQRQVTVPRDFYMGAFPVTQEQWQAVMGSNPSWFSRNGGAAKVKDISDADLKQFPVEQVSWDGIQKFLKLLNEREKNSGFLYRLPTDAEWEYSCREGATSEADCAFDFYFGDPTRNLSHPTNDLSSAQANFDGNYPAGNAPKGPYLERTTKVGSYQPNRLGLYDMHGNVWEWCADLVEARASARVIRGGSWARSGSHCRASRRDGLEPDYRLSDLGFRVAAVPSGK
jgi:formylglycine-generating enzyme required for sulfatase activity